MKNILYILWAATLWTSCATDEITPDPLQNLRLAATLQNTEHQVALYTSTGRLETGYNAVTVKITDLTGRAVETAAPAWTPLMQMHSMSHSCPASALSPAENGLFQGYLVFQMASNDSEYWELTLNFNVNGSARTVKDRIRVDESAQRRVQSFQGADGKRYITALAEPAAPKVGTQPMKALIYQMENMMKFTPVSGYRLKIDPRMPGMGNHTSPNNADLKPGAGEWYEGALSLSMTGYWKINLQLESPEGVLLKGEPVTEENQASSIFFEIEF